MGRGRPGGRRDAPHVRHRVLGDEPREERAPAPDRVEPLGGELHQQVLHPGAHGHQEHPLLGPAAALAEWKQLFELSDRYGFAVAADECYSEIYFEEGEPPRVVIEFDLDVNGILNVEAVDPADRSRARRCAHDRRFP